MSESEDMWDEIHRLGEELELLKTKRELLAEHLGELEQLHQSLTHEAQKAQDLADKVKGMM